MAGPDDRSCSVLKIASCDRQRKKGRIVLEPILLLRDGKFVAGAKIITANCVAARRPAKFQAGEADADRYDRTGTDGGQYGAAPHAWRPSMRRARRFS